MAEGNMKVSAGCSNERLQFGHALPHLFLFFFFFFFLDSQNFGLVGSVKREIKLVWPYDPLPNIPMHAIRMWVSIKVK